MILTIRTLARRGWLIAMLCASLAACGDDDGPGGNDGNNGGGTPPTTQPQPQPQPTPVRPVDAEPNKAGVRCAP